MKSFGHPHLCDRRFVFRHDMKTRLRVRIWKSLVPEQRGTSVNLSERGICFVTALPLEKGELVEILLKMPEQVSGEPMTEWRCTGSIVRVERDDSTNEYRVGMEFYRCEVLRSEVPESTPWVSLHRRSSFQIDR